ncbi:hypothetical protein [Guptibacillus algicola]|uniref:hypothetical protein n=1 Tax=Guptibacillus algicola TaxID=225844 RepID=UPI001CD4A140|nr:hypothetical protein [Alkalihalobacillus algicola]MCA0986477.1 hypothetical protein [Alkalihalobacillus algicola]
MNINQKDAILIQKALKALQNDDNRSEYTSLLSRLENKPGMNVHLDSFMNDSTDYNNLT